LKSSSMSTSNRVADTSPRALPPQGVEVPEGAFISCDRLVAPIATLILTNTAPPLPSSDPYQ
jgi:hypothetical protein